MCKAKEIYEFLVKEHPSSMLTLTQITYNSSGNKNFIKSDAKVFNFDCLENLAGSKPNKEKSPDALFLHDNTLYFVEFKEGACDRTDIRQKIHEGIISLFQYSISRKIIKRDDFFNLKIKYAVIRRENQKKKSSFYNTLESSMDIFNLKNIEGFLVQKTAVKFYHDSIFCFLNKVSNGEISKIEIFSPDQKNIDTYPKLTDFNNN